MSPPARAKERVAHGLAAGHTFHFRGAIYRLARPREVFEGWEAEPMEQ